MGSRWSPLLPERPRPAGGAAAEARRCQWRCLCLLRAGSPAPSPFCRGELRLLTEEPLQGTMVEGGTGHPCPPRLWSAAGKTAVSTSQAIWAQEETSGDPGDLAKMQVGAGSHRDDASRGAAAGPDGRLQRKAAGAGAELHGGTG